MQSAEDRDICEDASSASRRSDDESSTEVDDKKYKENSVVRKPYVSSFNLYC